MGCGRYMKNKKMRAALLLALCLLLQGCGRWQTAEQEEERWSFQEDAVENETQNGGSETEMGTGSTGVYRGSSADSGANGENDRAEEFSVCEEMTEQQPEGYVYLCGAVECPGVYGIHEGMRIFEVLELAGGMTGEADPDWINQAQTVSDGQMLRIYTREETELMRSSGMTAGTGQDGTMAGTAGDGAAAVSGSDEKVNINTAAREELMTLPGIGEAKADAILRYRQEHGAFGSIEEICQISGIKEAVFSNIKDRITV